MFRISIGILPQNVDKYLRKDEIIIVYKEVYYLYIIYQKKNHNDLEKNKKGTVDFCELCSSESFFQGLERSRLEDSTMAQRRAGERSKIRPLYTTSQLLGLVVEIV